MAFVIINFGAQLFCNSCFWAEVMEQDIESFLEGIEHSEIWMKNEASALYSLKSKRSDEVKLLREANEALITESAKIHQLNSGLSDNSKTNGAC